VASGHRCRIVDSPKTCGLGGQFLKAGPARWPKRMSSPEKKVQLADLV
jgi:hypothetical protein